MAWSHRFWINPKTKSLIEGFLPPSNCKMAAYMFTAHPQKNWAFKISKDILKIISKCYKIKEKTKINDFLQNYNKVKVMMQFDCQDEMQLILHFETWFWFFKFATMWPFHVIVQTWYENGRAFIFKY
jgi:hypothetical protein